MVPTVTLTLHTLTLCGDTSANDLELQTLQQWRVELFPTALTKSGCTNF